MRIAGMAGWAESLRDAELGWLLLLFLISVCTSHWIRETLNLLLNIGTWLRTAHFNTAHAGIWNL